MSDLSLRQRKFARLVPRLLDYAHSQHYELTLGEVWRSPEEAARQAALGTGIRKSLHGERLAIDLNVWKDGVYVTDIAAYRELGNYWRSLDGDCRWGGAFATPDPDHFSIRFEGRA